VGRRKIFIEAQGLLDPHFSGVGQYILGILRGLDQVLEQISSQGGECPEVKLILPFDKLRKFQSFGFKNLGYRIVPFTFDLMSALLHSHRLPPLDRICGRGVFLFTRFTTSKLKYCPSMVVIYDLSYELHRQYVETRNGAFLRKAVPESLKRVSRVITISENARSELIQFYGLDPRSVKIASPAADAATFYRRNPDEIRRTRAHYEIQSDYILSLSNLEPRKNLETLVDVYGALPGEVRDRLGLLLVGELGWKANRLAEKVLTWAERGRNIMRPSTYVIDKHKPAIYSGAAMLVYPSHYEGFGIPPLEALACGTPVITSDNSSLPEVVGRTGRMVPSERPDLLQNAILDTYTNLREETTRVNALGPAQARRFCWLKSARVFLDAAQELQ